MIKEEDFAQEANFNKEFLSLVLFRNEVSISDSLAKQFTERIIFKEKCTANKHY